MSNYNREQLLLELRNAVCDKEGYVANAYIETHSRGGWSCDWNHLINLAQQKVQELLNKLDDNNIQITNKLDNTEYKESILL